MMTHDRADLSSAVSRVMERKAGDPPRLRAWMRMPENLEQVRAERAKDPPTEWTVITEGIVSLGIKDANGGPPNWRSVRQAYDVVAKPRRKPRNVARPRVGRPQISKSGNKSARG